ncbi:AraC family transcriptional regulator [Vibrio sp.]|uniref:AraC family transcriptional regulator n=1 Tax=Vibrio viridaestus TaxID=2487322 RepID=A0A3N9TFJ5_9VIBR|nr:AraC family transcriptional regulator [Vibrio viridaestus]MDC0609336.1 AraC family transcriptional regulator [Vibrio sp.]RQW63017.1 AraC family transcriptional regulator [Vibrio viridaestus]
MLSKKYLIHWFGCNIEKMPNFLRHQIYQRFYVREVNLDISELTNPDLKVAVFYAKGVEMKSILPAAIKICSNLNKPLIILHEDYQSLPNLADSETIKSYSVTELKIKGEAISKIYQLASEHYIEINDTSSQMIVRGHATTAKRSMRESIEYINKNIHEKIILSEMAKKMHCSECYFSKQFHSYMGMSFQDYIINKRVALAKTLLVPSNKEKIASIAYQCGYHDISYFSRIFKKRTGLTPQQYRAQADINIS